MVGKQKLYTISNGCNLCHCKIRLNGIVSETEIIMWTKSFL